MKPVMAENNLYGMNHFRIELPAGHRALREGRESVIHGTYLVTTTTLGRQPRFADFEVAAGVCRCFRSREALADAHLLAWVLMPDHAHWLIELGETELIARRCTIEGRERTGGESCRGRGRTDVGARLP